MCDTATILSGYERHGRTFLANAIGKTKSSIDRILNPNDEGYDLRTRDIIPLIQATNDFTLLDHIETHLGRIAIQVKPSNGADLCALTKEAGHALTAYAEAIEDGKITKQEANKCIEELTHLVQVAMGLLQQCHAIESRGDRRC